MNIIYQYVLNSCQIRLIHTYPQYLGVDKMCIFLSTVDYVYINVNIHIKC